MSLVEFFVPTIVFNIFHLEISSKLMGEKIKIKSVRNVIIFCFLTLMLSLSTYIFDNFLKSVVNFLSMFAAYYFIFKKDINKTFSVGFTVFLMFFVSEILFSLLLVLVFGATVMSSNALETLTIFSLCNLMIGLIAVGIYNIKYVKSLSARMIKSYERTKFTGIVLVVLFSLCILANKNFLLFGFNLQYGLNLLLVILFCAIIFLLLKEKNESTSLSIKYEQLFHYLENYEKELSRKSMCIHEFENQLIAIKGFNDNKNEDLEKYLATIINDTRSTETKLLKDMENVPIGGLRGLIYYKLSYLTDEGFFVNTSVSSKVKKTLFSDRNSRIYKDIIKITGILLDNAIESARESKEKQIYLEIYYEKGTFFFVLSNTYGKALNLLRLSETGYSTKGKGRGYGLTLANKIVSDNQFIHLDRQIINHLYVVTLSIETKNISSKTRNVFN